MVHGTVTSPIMARWQVFLIIFSFRFVKIKINLLTWWTGGPPRFRFRSGVERATRQESQPASLGLKYV